MYDLLPIFIAITAAAVVLQMLLLLAMYLAIRKLSARLESVVDETRSRVYPLLENGKAIQQDVKTFLETTRPKIDLVVDNAVRATTATRSEVERLQRTLNDVVDRFHLQVIRVDELATRTLDRVEETSEKVQQSVLTPVRQVSGLAQAISVGLATYFRSQRRGRNGGPDDMFI